MLEGGAALLLVVYQLAVDLVQGRALHVVGLVWFVHLPRQITQHITRNRHPQNRRHCPQNGDNPQSIVVEHLERIRVGLLGGG